MPRKPTYPELERRVAELQQQQQQQINEQLTKEIEKSRQTGDELAQTKALLETLLTQAPVGFCYFDLDLRFILINERLAEINGLPVSAHMGRTVAEVVPTLLPTVQKVVSQILETGKSVEGHEFSGETSAHPGVTRFWNESWYPVLNAAGRIMGFGVIVEEITDRKRAEEALRENERRFRSYFELGMIGISITSPTKGWLEANDEMCRILGYDRRELLTKTWAEITHPDDLAADILQFERLLIGEIDAYTLEKRFIRKDGRIVYSIISIRAVRRPDGSVDYLVGFLQDITDRKQAEEQLIRNQGTFSELVERAPFGIYIVDSNFRIAHMNTGSQTGAFQNVRPVIGRDFSEAMRIIWPEPVAAEIVGHFRHTLETGKAYYSPRFTNPRHDIGITESYEWELHRMTLPDGQHGVICYYFDSTALRNAELALQEANATLEKKVAERTQELEKHAAQLRALTGELTLTEQRERSRLANILHDHLQQILVAAKFRAAILGRGGDALSKQGAKEVEDLIDESIAASRSLTAELSPPILHDAGLNEGLQWLARRMANTQGLFVDLELSEIGRLPDGLKILLFQSVRELLFNVVKHSNTRSAVVNLRRLDGSLQLTVSDEGIGFDPAAMPPAGEGGRGFGLLGIQERLGFIGGNLEIQSTPGQGSRFVLSVPLAMAIMNEAKGEETMVLPEAQLMTSAKSLDQGRKIRVILADDHAVVRQGIANLISDEPDIEVVGQAADGQEAVELAARLLPDVILMDVSMPRLNGVEATRVIRNEFAEIRIIGLSMFEDIERAQAMRDAGAVDYLAKSGPAEVLINAIRAHKNVASKSYSA